MPGPLDGVRVLDFTRVLAGPHCTRLLADLGADVIKVEPPQGDLTRFFVPRVGSMGVYFAQQNTGKRNVSVDLDKPEAVELLLNLVPQVDVVAENFRPGVMERLGLDHARVAAINPRVVYASITGYGQDGPWRDRPAYAPTVHADMGYLDAMARPRGADPEHDHFSHADLYAAIHGVVAILAALYDRERTGRGQHVDVAMASALLSSSEHLAAIMATDREAHTPPPGDGTQMYQTGDGRWVTVAGDPAPRGTFGSWCEAMDRPDLADDPRFATDDDRRANREALLDIIRAWIASFDDLEELDSALQKGRLVLGVVRTLREAATSPWARARGAVVEISDRGGGTFNVPDAPWRFSERETGVHGEPAFRGEHNRTVFGELAGLDEAELDRLESEGVLSHRPPRSSA